MSNFNRNHPLPEPGDVVEITAKKVSAKVQPLFQVGKRFIVERVLTDVGLYLVVVHPKRKKALLYMSAERYSWKILPRATAENAEVVKAHDALRGSFTERELVMMGFVPMVIQTLVWIYADKCMEYAVAHRLAQTVKVTRLAKELKAEYDRDAAKDLDGAHRASLRRQTLQFIEGCGNDFPVMYYSVNNEVKRVTRHPHDELVTNAAIGFLLIKFLFAWSEKYDAEIYRRVGMTGMRFKYPIMERMLVVFDAYMGDVKGFRWDKPEFSTALGILRNKFDKVEFNIVA